MLKVRPFRSPPVRVVPHPSLARARECVRGDRIRFLHFSDHASFEVGREHPISRALQAEEPRRCLEPKSLATQVETNPDGSRGLDDSRSEEGER